MFAVIRTGGKQYKVTEGETLDIELVDFPAEGEKKITISDVLMVGNGDKFSLGNPLLSGATVGLEPGGLSCCTGATCGCVRSYEGTNGFPSTMYTTVHATSTGRPFTR